MAKKQYSILAIVNGIKTRKYTDNLEEALLSLKPDLMHTEMYVTVKKGDTVSERRLTALQGKKLFNDNIFREVFINNLMLT